LSKELNTDPKEYQPIFIWNEPTDSIPLPGSIIEIQLISNDTIYIGTKD
jgi:hypothetical protein